MPTTSKYSKTVLVILPKALGSSPTPVRKNTPFVPAHLTCWCRTARACIDLLARAPGNDGHLPAGARALDVGCAVGGSSFELSTEFAEVIGKHFCTELTLSLSGPQPRFLVCPSLDVCV